MTRRLTIYIPKPGELIDKLLAQGSGIVGEPHAVGVLLHYEGNLYKASNLVRYEDRLKHAAGRLVARYPTRAMLVLPEREVAETLLAVGGYDSDAWEAHIDPAFAAQVAAYSQEEV